MSRKAILGIAAMLGALALLAAACADDSGESDAAVAAAERDAAAARAEADAAKAETDAAQAEAQAARADADAAKAEADAATAEADAAEADAAAARAQAEAAEAAAAAAESGSQADREAAAEAMAAADQAQADADAAAAVADAAQSAADAAEADAAAAQAEAESARTAASEAEDEAAAARAAVEAIEAEQSAIKGTIAFSYGNETAGIYPIVAGPARIQAESRGYEFLEGAANGDCTQQVNDVENFIVQEVDAIVVLPLCGLEPLQPTIDKAVAAGIVVIGYSTEVPGGSAAIVYQNVAGAEKVANEALRWLEEDFTGDRDDFSWVLFTFDQCGTACTQRTDPIREIIVNATGVAPLEAAIVAEAPGLEATETFFQSNPNIAMIIGINDAGALGAYQAVLAQMEAGRDASEFFVAGMDGQNEALELIAAGGGEGGIYRASGALILDELGQAVANLPISVLEGHRTDNLELPYELITPANPDRAQEILDAYVAFTGG